MDNLTIDEVERILARSLRLETEEKMGIYHGIIQILKQSSNQTEAASQIVMEVEELFKQKALIAEEGLEMKNDAKTSGKVSPIFRRVG